MRIALIAALLSTLLFILGSSQAGIASLFGLSIARLNMSGHLFGTVGNGLLIWAATTVSDMEARRDRLPLVAIVLTIAYHLVAIVGYAVGFQYGLFEVTLAFWALKTLLWCALAFDFLTLDDSQFRAAGVLLLLAGIASCPFSLPGGWGLAQWIVAKLSACVLALELYSCSDEDNR
ncbi:MAG: hypothetical protein K5896_08945 [Prevotella sp.]|nr:hypothetical protein [Prevotella sp.]